MFIIVNHDITNQKAFFGAGDAVVNDAPHGIKPIQFLPSTDGKRAVCLWEGKSVDAVRNYLETKIAASSKNTYYEVDSKVAIGLPVHA